MFVVDEIGDEAFLAVFRLLRWRFPLWIKHVGTLPQLGGGIAVTIEAPSHRQRLGLPHQRHGADGTVTRRAADALGDMNRMVEIDVVGQLVDLVPAMGLFSARLARTGASISVWV